MNDFLALMKEDLNLLPFQKNKMFLTYSEYIAFSVVPQRKYRNCYKDKLMRLPFVKLLAYNRAKRLFYKYLNVDTFFEYKNHFLKNMDEYFNLYNSLADKESKIVLIELLKARFTGDFRKSLSQSVQYFGEEFIKWGSNEVFVDCGAWIGDTTKMYLDYNPYFTTCYVIEPNNLNLAYARDNLTNRNAIFHFIPKGVADCSKVLPFLGGGISGFFGEKTIENDDITKLELDTIDNILQEPATYIKMDIEGFEEKALLGAKMQIAKYHPKLAICIYHKPDDYITIFRLIQSLDTTNQYKYYIRHYTPTRYETVLYAVPQ